MTDLICVDFAAQDDLMLWDQLARGVLERSRRGDRLLILIGSGESEERRLETAGHSVQRVEGALTVVDAAVEASMRESVRTVSNRLTDEGVFAVGMMACDRNLVSESESALNCSAQFENRVWMGPGVMPVLGCFVAGKGGHLKDVHPLRVASALAETLADEVRIVMLARGNSTSLNEALVGQKEVSWSKMKGENAIHEQSADPSSTVSVHVSLVTEIASGRMAKIC